MKIWLISQEVNNGWDTFDSAVVTANTKNEARYIHPCKEKQNWNGIQKSDYDGWCNALDVIVEYIGIAKEGTKKGVILSSYHSG
jgi:hypothetical protein